MDTQNTPIHVRLWDKHFWTLAISNLLLVMSTYMLIPIIPMQLKNDGYTMSQMAIVLGVFFVGIYLFGNISAYLVQRYRRKMVFLIYWPLILPSDKAKFSYRLYYSCWLAIHTRGILRIIAISFVEHTRN